jgi:hypothetical protein
MNDPTLSASAVTMTSKQQLGNGRQRFHQNLPDLASVTVLQ